MTTVVRQVLVSELTSADTMRDPIALYRQVFRLCTADPAPSPRLLVSLVRNGGIAVGAYLDGELVGFSYGFPGRAPIGHLDAQRAYHYMELLVVRPDCQNSGIGRTLMHQVRAIAIRRGLQRIYWAYDPLRAANAHFYLDVIGACGYEFIDNMYGVEDTGRDRGFPTHRIVARWDLDAPARHWPQPPTGLVLGAPVPDHIVDFDSMLLAIPEDWEYRSATPALHHDLCAIVRDLMAGGYRAVSCRRTGDGRAVYRLVCGPLTAGHTYPL
ncbi:GNAT family N-acetyltransferase [Nocardia goodfellowii]|uniref:GNAT superfamily acetyltransferase n=1 Tax=Nocardia goodfellowii TaxID=882446 RepID=A0ABS4QG94_9NOCA|nr:GNAT family N-acetyltransferase [Nocardia goodfellowii]MBP2190725.1 putative GNAT superfamily acetyltransferase [Nocardia goodfellowii]